MYENESMDSDARPAHHANSIRTLFQNPWDDIGDSSTAPTRQWSFPEISEIPIEWAKQHPDHPHKPVEVIKPNFGNHSTKLGNLKATWLGHASFLLELVRQSLDDAPPIRVLYDPIFSDRAGPTTWTGVKRRLPPPCTVEELPDFQYVVYSHNHYDHLDLPTVQSIMQLKGEDVRFVVPLGNKSWFIDCGIPSIQISELDWWDELSMPRGVKFVCTPAQHASGRGLLDKQTTLWASWVIEQTLDSSESVSQRIAIYHAGDTGYMTTKGPCPIFKEIGEKYGPFYLAMIPIWRGGTLSFIARMGLKLNDHPLISSLHATPSQAIAIHLAIRSKHSLAMHFATFAGSDIEAFDPIVELTRAKDENQVGNWEEDGGFGVIDVGETALVPIRPSSEL